MFNIKKCIGLSVALGLPIGLFIALNHTKISLPKTRDNLAKLKYATTEDLWWKKENNKKLVIFLHGMYGPPATFEDIGPLLMENGWDVYAPALPASTSTKRIEDLKEVGPWSWDESMKIAKMKIEKSKKGYKTVVLGGHSQGGSLSLAIAEESDFDGLIVASGPVSLYSKGMGTFNNLCIYFSGILQYIKPEGRESSIRNFEEKAKVEPLYESTEITYPKTVYSFKYGLKSVRRNLKKIKMPLLLTCSKNDRIVDFRNKLKIEKEVSSEKIVSMVFNVPREVDPYGSKHKIFNYILTKNELNESILKFLESL